MFETWRIIGLIWLWSCIGLGILTFFVFQFRRSPDSPPSFWLKYPYVWGLGVALAALVPNFVIEYYESEQQFQAMERDSEAIKTVFSSFQRALKDADGPAIWELLNTDSQARCEQAAAELKEVYLNAPLETRRTIEHDLALSENELNNLDAVTYLRSRLFIDDHRSVLAGEVSGWSSAGGPVEVKYRYQIRNESVEGTLPMTRSAEKWLLKINPPPVSFSLR